MNLTCKTFRYTATFCFNKFVPLFVLSYCYYTYVHWLLSHGLFWMLYSIEISTDYSYQCTRISSHVNVLGRIVCRNKWEGALTKFRTVQIFNLLSNLYWFCMYVKLVWIPQRIEIWSMYLSSETGYQINIDCLKHVFI